MFDIDYTAIMTSIVSLVGGGWLYSVYTAKPRKTSIELENVGRAMQELNTVIDTMRDSDKQYREYTDKTINELHHKVERLEQSIMVKDEAIYAAYDCPLPKKTSECVVLRVYKQCKECKVETKVIDDDNN